MSRKKHPHLEKQITFRTSQDVYDRVETAANKLGLDSSGLLRLMCLQKLPEYELMAEEVEKKGKKAAPSEK